MMHYVSKWEVMQPKSCLHNGDLGSGSYNSGRSWTSHWQFFEIIISVFILLSNPNKILGIIKKNIEAKPETTIFFL